MDTLVSQCLELEESACPKALNVLMLEDSEADAELVLAELRRAGFEPHAGRTRDAAGFLRSLNRELDVILADCLPGFDAAQALALLQDSGLDVPFIVVSGTISEELAIDYLRQGAADYLLKDRLGRLGQAIDHAMEARRLRAEKVRAEEALRASEERFRRLTENASDVMYRYRVQPALHLEYINPAVQSISGYRPEDFHANPDLLLEVIHPEDRAELVTQLDNACAGVLQSTVLRWKHRDGRIVWTEDRPVAVYDDEARLVAVEGVARDITGSKLAESALRESQRFLQSTLDALSAHIAILDETGTIIAVNGAWRRFAKDNGLRSLTFGVGTSYLQVCQAAGGTDVLEARRAIAGIQAVMSRQRDSFTMEYACNSPAERAWYALRVTRFSGAGPVRTVVAHENITERKRMEEQLLKEAYHDALTGLPNRTLFVDRLGLALAHAQRRDDHAFAVLFVDVDRFKLINDSLGHGLGDQLLARLAERLQTTVRGGDTVARFGGDEFAILLEDLESPEDAVRAAERIRLALAEPFQLDGQEVYASGSVGIVLGAPGYEKPDDVLRDAHTAMYRAKSLGRARHEIFDHSMHARAVQRLQLEGDLRRAIERQEFLLHYQPIVSLQHGRIAGFEALVRWQHPQRGLVPPGEFIPVAEETGLIVPMSQWVLREAFAQLRRWHQQQQPGDAPLTMAVNLSTLLFAQPDFLPFLRNVLADSGLDARTVKLEITESAIMQNAESATAMLREIKEMGFQLSLDDFGTGYSSLSYLHRFPLDILKIDRAFVGHIKPQSRDLEFVRTILTLGHSLGMSVVAEGVETAEQLALLRDLRCEYGQGFFMSRPLPAAAAAELLARDPRW